MFDEADRETGLRARDCDRAGDFRLDLHDRHRRRQCSRPVRQKARCGRQRRQPRAHAAVKLYFELGKADMPADALTRLAPLIQAAQDSTVGAGVSGYHDASGDAAANAELAKQRAFAVRDLLATAGVSEQRIELAKPSVTTGGTDAREARRVDVTLR